KGGDGPGAAVGVEIERVVADHAAKIREDIGREDVFVGGDAHGLEIVGSLELRNSARRVLPLGELLKLFVWNFVTRELVADAEREVIFRSEVAFVAQREIARGAAIG